MIVVRIALKRVKNKKLSVGTLGGAFFHESFFDIDAVGPFGTRGRTQ